MIENKLNDIFRAVFHDPSIEVNPFMTAADVEEWNSQTHVEMIYQVEQAFGVSFKLTELRKMKNVGDLIASIDAQLNKK